jgi:fatty-acyl-CoA synthase
LGRHIRSGAKRWSPSYRSPRRAVVTLDAVREHAATKIARYKVPHQLRIVEKLPRNASGKLDKAVLRAILAVSAG